MKKSLLGAVLLGAISLSAVYPAQEAKADTCGSDFFSRVGCALDPTNPSSNGGAIPIFAPPPTPPQIPQVSSIESEDVSVGRFYRQTGKPGVFRMHSKTEFCYVQTPKQLYQLSGVNDFSRVTVVYWNPDSQLQSRGECTWPDGFYQIEGRAPVYKLYSSSKKMCWVDNPSILSQLGGDGIVRTIEGDITRKRLATNRIYFSSCAHLL